MSGNIHTLGDSANNGGRTLGGGNAEPLPAAWANRTSQPRIGRIGGPSTSSSSNRGPGRFATLRDFASAEGPRPSSRHSDDDDDDTPQNFFAGGERSGLSVENPVHGERRRGGAQDQVRDILRRAAEGSRSQATREAARSGPFRGAGNTLGSDEKESEVIPDPNAASSDAEETAIRNITFWRTGFTIENGPLLLYDNPESAELLQSIQQGLAPPEALNVRIGQPVELRVAKRLDEDYVPPPPGPFAGAGHRLGSPLPAVVTSSSGNTTSTAASGPAAGTSSTSSGSFEVDMSAPTTSVQIRLADGTRLVSRMNLTHTIGDIRRFINASRPGMSERPYTVQTTLPVKVLDDESQTIEAAGLKNSVVVQRWL
ncbi:SEP-domain-containing protein [Serendipita vermifera]|nr:SEP-domain-containing protein [Serendipita vermifera]